MTSTLGSWITAARSASSILRRSGMSLRLSRFHRQVVPLAPFRPRPVINGDVFLAEQIEPQRRDAGGNAAAATGHDRPLHIDPGLIDERLDFFTRFEGPVSRVQHVGEGQVEATGNMTSPAARPEIGFGSGEAA